MPQSMDSGPALLCLGSINADFQMEIARPFGAETLLARRFIPVATTADSDVIRSVAEV